MVWKVMVVQKVMWCIFSLQTAGTQGIYLDSLENYDKISAHQDDWDLGGNELRILIL